MLIIIFLILKLKQKNTTHKIIILNNKKIGERRHHEKALNVLEMINCCMLRLEGVPQEICCYLFTLEYALEDAKVT